MKLQTVARRLEPVLSLMRCPLCGGALALENGQSLVCESRHCFDLSAKGYVNLAPTHDQQAEKYGAELFAARSRVFADGFYAHVAQAVGDAVFADGAHPIVADVGCGEGYYARVLSERGATVLAMDLSRDAVQAAAKHPLCCLVADLTRMPLRDASLDVLLDVLTPADYREFRRVLKPSGLLVKVVPADDYLIEIRNAAASLLHAEAFSNARVIEHLQASAQIVSRRVVRQTRAVSPEQSAAFVRMTPMTFGLTDEQRASIVLSQITVAMEVLVCRFAEA